MEKITFPDDIENHYNKLNFFKDDENCYWDWISCEMQIPLMAMSSASSHHHQFPVRFLYLDIILDKYIVIWYLESMQW